MMRMVDWADAENWKIVNTIRAPQNAVRKRRETLLFMNRSEKQESRKAQTLSLQDSQDKLIDTICSIRM
jgi:hypothetical protein